MATAEDIDTDAPRKPSKAPLLIGMLLAGAGAGGGFFAVQSGLLSQEPGAKMETKEAGPVAPLPSMSFVALDQIVVSLGPSSSSRHLRFRAELEVADGYRDDVEALKPRIIDVLNSYLRALEPGDIEGVSALIELRAQMLRRVQLVAGQGRVRDLLVMEFVLN